MHIRFRLTSIPCQQVTGLEVAVEGSQSEKRHFDPGSQELKFQGLLLKAPPFQPAQSHEVPPLHIRGKVILSAHVSIDAWLSF